MMSQLTRFFSSLSENVARVNVAWDVGPFTSSGGKFSFLLIYVVKRHFFTDTTGLFYGMRLLFFTDLYEFVWFRGVGPRSWDFVARPHYGDALS